MSNATKLYIITPSFKKSTYAEEEWTKTLSTGKTVSLWITKDFRGGKFYIHLTDDEKDDILKKNKIVLNEYDFTCDELYNGYDPCVEIQSEEQFTEEEMDEIKEYEDEADADFLTNEYLEDYGWTLSDTIYGFDCGCELVSNEATT